MFKFIDGRLNKITMYRYTLYYLIFLVGVAAVLSFLGLLNYNPLDILINSFVAVIVCFLTNFVFAKIFKAETNIESVFITALILVLIIPVQFPANLMFIIGASGVAMAAKYLLTIDKKHLFNPAAVSVAAISLLSPEHSATWWVGTSYMLPFVLGGGLFLIRKTQRERMVIYFFVTYLILTAISSVMHNGSIHITWLKSILNTGLIFFMCIILIEPLTSPTTKKLQGYYAVVVAFLYSTTQLRLFGIIFAPEIALCIGNIFSYIVNPNFRLLTPMLWKKQLSPDTFEFAFAKQKDFKFIPGQYMEWTLPQKNTDSRGNRRYFSISSSPAEKEIKIAVKFYNPSSSYKKELLNLEAGNIINAAQVSGDFTLPKKIKTPIVFIAGGVGIAPFRSMIQYIIDKDLQTDIIIIYSNKTVNDILFLDIFEKAKNNGVKTIYNLTDLKSVPWGWGGTKGYVTKDYIHKYVNDYNKRIFYISGPQLMVQNFEDMLKSAGIRKSRIKSDFFPGYAEK